MSWTIKKAEHRRIDASELWCWKTLESPLDYKKIKPVNPKGNQPWTFIGRTDAEAKVLILWIPDVKNPGKDPDAGKYWQQKKVAADEIAAWHHWLRDSSLSKFWETVKSGKPDSLQFIGLLWVGHNLVTDQQQIGQPCWPFLSSVNWSLDSVCSQAP